MVELRYVDLESPKPGPLVDRDGEEGSCSRTHPVHPPQMPLRRYHCRTETSCGIRAGARERGFEKDHNRVQKRQQERRVTADPFVTQKHQEQDYERERRDRFPRKSNPYGIGGTRSRGTEEYACPHVPPEEKGKAACDRSRKLGRDVSGRMTGANLAFDEKGESDHGIDVRTAYFADRRNGNKCTGRAKEKTGDEPSYPGIGKKPDDGASRPKVQNYNRQSYRKQNRRPEKLRADVRPGILVRSHTRQ